MTPQPRTTVLGIYPTRSGAEAGLQALKEAGFRNADVSVLFPEDLGTKEVGTETSTKAPEAAAAGAGTGAVIGGALAWLAGIGALAIPGAGPFIAAGPLVAALAGATAGGTLGVIAGALVGLGITEGEAKRYEGHLRSGGILLSVHCDSTNSAVMAQEVLRRTGAQDISPIGEAKEEDAEGDRPLARTGTDY